MVGPDLNKIATHPLQTKEWGNFRTEWGNEVHVFSFGQITIHKIPHTNFKIGIFEKGIEPTSKILKELYSYAKKNKIIFIKLEPNFIPKNAIDRKKIIKRLKDNGCVPGKTFFTSQTFFIDLTKSEEDLMKNFSSKTRYNIRLAQKKGVSVKIDNSKKAFEKYLELTFQTAKRQNFFSHTPKYHKFMWEHLHTRRVESGKEPIANLMVARYGDEILTTWILFSWKDFLYYPYGASSDKHRNVMANNLVMWEAIKFGKKTGRKTFDLWGREEGRGFTKFKEGYHPKIVEFVGTWDLVVNKNVYSLYRVAEKFRWFVLKNNPLRKNG